LPAVRFKKCRGVTSSLSLFALCAGSPLSAVRVLRPNAPKQSRSEAVSFAALTALSRGHVDMCGIQYYGRDESCQSSPNSSQSIEEKSLEEKVFGRRHAQVAMDEEAGKGGSSVGCAGSDCDA
jgi:hypothetical protein